MELDFGTIAIGVFSLLACILPFILDYRSRKKKENKLLEPLKKIAQQQNCQINEYEVGRNFVIGIDNIEKSVFFYKEEQGKVISQVIDLDIIQTCKVITSHKTMSHAKGNYKVVIKLELSFISNTKTEQTWEFYNADVLPQLNGEVQLTEKWSKLINKQLNNSLVTEHDV
ncbi:hypothetical protein V9L05_00680 [Bernardetia sp. Wsw4-3y2]|uniref:hypothetical protein n=1 Tax=Bernardetia sp. Wsw4-3y2 TaxID=3127471 RepID=UPI0030D15EC0